MECSEGMKNNPTYSITIANHAQGKVWHFFLFFFFLLFFKFLFLKREIHLYYVLWTSLKFSVGQSREFWSAHPFIFFYTFFFS